MGFFSLEIGKKALQTSQLEQDVTGHNISNANTEGYSRQNVNLEALIVRKSNYGVLGASVDVTSITRSRNTFLDDRMLKEQPEKAKWEVRETNLTQLETIINEPSDQSVRFILDQFWTSLQDVSNNPEDSAVRVSVKERAIDLANTISSTYEQLKGVKKDLDENIAIKINSINSILKQVSQLNIQITTLEAGSDMANDLRDQRDLAVENLSKLVNVQVSRSDSEFSVIVGGRTAVQGSVYKELKTMSDANVNGGMNQIKWADTDQDLYLTSGELKGLQDMRDEDVNKYIEYFDQLAISLIDQMNEVHKSGFDINGLQGEDFFGSFETYNETLDIDRDGKMEAMIYKMKGDKVIKEPINTPLTAFGLTAGSGKFEVNGMQISYDTTKDSLSNIVELINQSNSGVVAGIDPYNRLTLRGDKNDGYIIKTLEDTSGNLLGELGIFVGGATKFDFQEATTLDDITADRTAKPKEGAARSIYVKLDDVDRIAAAKGYDTDGDEIPDKSNGAGDGSNALALGGLRYKQSIGKYTFANYFASLVSDLGVSAQQASRSVDTQSTLINNLELRRQSDIGVSLDEEMTNMIKYQQCYNAAAQYITTVNSMIDTLMGML